ncbi:unnamed protein product [Pleuronectes platessa]|uniref:Uncharacterized protein n=1 Tax=Pleuronectes platessa TaxID=8262 RepID=A0A9N7UW03_PLEPL|nr:unnamed protein product [Pleuronectes platessa]
MKSLQPQTLRSREKTGFLQVSKKLRQENAGVSQPPVTHLPPSSSSSSSSSSFSSSYSSSSSSSEPTLILLCNRKHLENPLLTLSSSPCCVVIDSLVSTSFIITLSPKQKLYTH